MLKPKRQPRRGATAVEAVWSLGVSILVVMGLLVLGLGVFHYQVVALLAREAARHASVHGAIYQLDGNGTSATEQSIYDYVVYDKTDPTDPTKRKFAVGLDPAHLTIQVQFVDGTTGAVSAWDGSTKEPLDTKNFNISNRVRVTVTYNWIAEFSFSSMFGSGGFANNVRTLTSICETPILY